MGRAITFIALLVVPLFAFAESDAVLAATIREAILSDPRSAEMSEADIEAMVAALAKEVGAQGITSGDIAWRPQDPAPWAETSDRSESACGYSAFICSLNEAFGFSGSPLVIPLLLGVCSAILLFVIGSILLHHHGHHPLAGALRKDE